jgi:hypothetical protein
MNPLLAFLISHRRPEGGAYAADTAAMDWFVFATLCCFFFLFGCFATAAFFIWRRSTRPEPHVQLLMELDESDAEGLPEETDKKPPQQAAPREPWEKTPDWWKQ